jgi:two-component system response regulator (stage 0 sporulation protein A)
MLNEEKMDKMMLELGFPESLRGTQYLREAAVRWTRDPGQRITGELYPALAEAFNATPTQIERCMRHAIERAWQQGNPDAQRRIFGWTYSASMGRPRVGEFVARMARVCREN